MTNFQLSMSETLPSGELGKIGLLPITMQTILVKHLGSLYLLKRQHYLKGFVEKIQPH